MKGRCECSKVMPEPPGQGSRKHISGGVAGILGDSTVLVHRDDSTVLTGAVENTLQLLVSLEPFTGMIDYKCPVSTASSGRSHSNTDVGVRNN